MPGGHIRDEQMRRVLGPYNGRGGLCHPKALGVRGFKVAMGLAIFFSFPSLICTLEGLREKHECFIKLKNGL